MTASKTGLTGPCTAELHQACTAPYDVYVHPFPKPAIRHRCGCPCHTGQPVRVEQRGEHQ